MTRQEIIEKAKCIVLPKSRGYPDTESVEHYDFSEFLKTHEHIKLGEVFETDLFLKDPVNAHHYNTPYHLRNTVPALVKLFNLPYKEEDFYLIENEINGIAYSYVIPNKKQKYKVLSTKVNSKRSETDETKITYTIERNISEYAQGELFGCVRNFNAPLFNELETEYHTIFKYTHQSGVIINESAPLAKTLLINSDSMNAPIVPILTRYYQRVIFLDNRYYVYGIDFSLFDFLHIGDYEIDDVLFLLWENTPLDIYISNNLK